VAAQFSQTTRSLTSDGSRSAIVVWLGAGVLLAAWAGWFCFGSVTVYEISKHARVEVQQASHPLSAQLAGRLVSTSLTLGTDVKAGDILVALDDSSERLRLREEETRLDALPGQFASLLREIEAREREKSADLQAAAAAADVARFHRREADAAVEGAKDYERRVTRLSTAGLVPTLDVTRAVTDTVKTTASRDAMTSDLGRIDLDAKTRASQHDAVIESLRHSLASLQGEMTTARATIARLETDIEKHVVRAPIAGRVGDVVPMQTGAYVAEGQRLATIVPTGDLVIVADFAPSLTLGRVRAGQHGRLRLDGFPWAQYGTIPATVTRVASEIRDDVVRVELTIDSAAASRVPMQHGLPGSVEVNVEEKPPAVLALRAAGLLLSGPSEDATRLAESTR
jgi:membrane fusion protein (multidrug efflux system)